ncbi:glycosyltransferase family 2 protein [Kerstersia sp.]|uniref:glycosyltransferase family 2 protein n=1 Tax=Kerstersia sp. TaxID=1930783 RepID=UPI003F909B24
MTNPPLVSIVMPAYNAASTLAASVDSALAQTWEHWELLLVVDAATDNTLAIAESYAARDERIRVFGCSTNQGVAQARNVALDHARGDYLAFLDSDDLWMPEKLAEQVTFMEREGVELCYAAYQRFNEGGPLNIVVPPEHVTYEQLLQSNVIANLTGIVKRQRVLDLRFKSIGHEDYLFWLSALQRIPHARRLPLTHPMARYRVQPESRSSKKLRNLQWQWHIYRHELGLPAIKSAALMAHYIVKALRKRSAPPILRTPH